MDTQEVSMLAYVFLGSHRYVHINGSSPNFFYNRLLFLPSSKDHIVQFIEMLIDLEFTYKVLQCGRFVKLFWSRIYRSINI
jgi:hypothetical protein